MGCVHFFTFNSSLRHTSPAVVDFICEPAVHLSKRAGLPLQDVQSIRQSLICQFGSYPESGRELWEVESARQRLISSGCPGLDKLMGGGVVTGQLTEVCGPPASGKTQVVTAMLVGRCPLARLGITQHSLYVQVHVTWHVVYCCSCAWLSLPVLS